MMEHRWLRKFLVNNIDGNVKYVVDVSGDQLHKAIDGRKWGNPTRLTEGSRKVLGKNCVRKGHACPNDQCTFREKYSTRNHHDAQKTGGLLCCSHCGFEMVKISSCQAEKLCISDDNRPGILVIIHRGSHSCSAEPKSKIQHYSAEKEIRSLWMMMNTGWYSSTRWSVKN